MKKTFPAYGFLGIVLLLLSEVFLFKKIEPFYRWFYCFAWWSYIFIADAFILRLKGNSLIHTRTKEFFLMIPWSVFIWLIFEAANFSLENWYYINMPHSIVERWAGYAIAYGTVLPGLFETTELLESTGFLKNSQVKKHTISTVEHSVLILLGVICLASSLLIPKYFFPFIWVGFTFLLEPFNYRYGGISLLKDLEEGKPRKIYLLLIAGLICGFLWEFWNYWSGSKWIYTIPFFREGKGFEMPYLGFLGFPPFAVQVYVMYNFISLLRSGRGWEASTYHLNLKKTTRSLTIVLTVFLIMSFYFLVFKTIDSNTVDSYYPRLKDAYWIDSKVRTELPKVGIANLDDLISKTNRKKERDELALRLLVPKELLVQWVEKAQLVRLKGLGIANLELLEKAGIHSVSALAEEEPDMLYKKIGYYLKGNEPLKKVKIRTWIQEARRQLLRSP